PQAVSPSAIPPRPGLSGVLLGSSRRLVASEPDRPASTPWHDAGQRVDLAKSLVRNAALSEIPSVLGAGLIASAMLPPAWLEAKAARFEIRPEMEARFQTMFHPYVEQFSKTLRRQGVSSLLSLGTQRFGNAYLRSPWRESV